MLSGKVVATPALQQAINRSNPDIRGLGEAMVGAPNRSPKGSGNGMWMRAVSMDRGRGRRSDEEQFLRQAGQARQPGARHLRVAAGLRQQAREIEVRGCQLGCVERIG